MKSPRATRLTAVWWVLAAIICLAAFDVRILAACDTFWLDEIWSLSLASTRSFWRILTDTELDNNHILNTMIIYWLGTEQPYIVYRIPAVVAGTAAVLVAGGSAWRVDRWTALAAILAFGGSFVLVQYSSEARGYAYLMLFSLLAWELSQAPAGWASDALFVLVALLGILAHSTFVFCYAGILAWSGLLFWRAKRERLKQLWPLCRRHLVPGLFMAWLFVEFYSDMVIGGTADARPTAATLALETASLTMGGPETGAFAWLIGFGVLCLFLWHVVWLYRSGSPGWIFYLVAVLVAPACVIAATQPEILYPRYYLVPVVFMLLGIVQVLCRTLGPRRWGRGVLLLALVAYLLANGRHIGDLLAVGRGDYPGAIRFMREHTAAPAVCISSRHDFRNLALLTYYQNAETGKPLTYFKRDQLPANGTEWRLYDEHARRPTPRDEIVDEAGNRYLLVAWFPHSGLSGFHWLIYRNANRF